MNSNMRRHYRNHTAPAMPRPQTIDNRRRRKRGSPPNLVLITGDSRTETHSTPMAGQSMGHDSDVSDDEEDELESLPDDASPVYMTYKRPWERASGYHEKDTYDSRPPPSSRYYQSHVRSGQAGNSFHKSPPPQGIHTYSPSAPYSRSFTDSKVSTALRPAFHVKPPVLPISQ